MAEKHCVYCGGDIPSSAPLCKHCDRFQAKWKNWSSQLLALAIVPIALAALAYAGGEASKIYVALAGETRLRPLYFANADYSSFLNDGDRDALLQTMSFECDSVKHASLVNVYRLIKVEETYVYHPTLSPAEIHYQPCTYVGGAVPVYGLTDEQKAELLQEIRNGKTLRQLDLELKYFAANHQQLNFHDGNVSTGPLVTFPAKMSLAYCHIGDDSAITDACDCIAVLFASEGDDGGHPFLQRIGKEGTPQPFIPPRAFPAPEPAV